MKHFSAFARLFCVSVLSLFFAAIAITSATAAQSQKAQGRNAGFNLQSFAQRPLSFEANQGQIAGPIRFFARGDHYDLGLAAGEAQISIHAPSGLRRKGSGQLNPDPQPVTSAGHAALVRMTLLNGNSQAPINGGSELPGHSNYLIGNDRGKWRTGVVNYSSVRYAGVYPGVDLLYYGNQNKLEFDFEVAPHADPGMITMKFDGAETLSVNSTGELTLKAAGQEMALHSPDVYQVVDGRRRKIAGSYQMHAKNEVSFNIGSYDRNRGLVIDPVLIYSTYLGGDHGELSTGIAVDSSGNAFVAGFTSSPNFPATPGVIKTTCGTDGLCNSLDDFFVAKYSPSGALLFSTFIGGSGDETNSGFPAHSIALDSTGNAYITGNTSSTDYPVTTGAFSTTLSASGGSQGAITKLNPTGTALVYSTYLNNPTGAKIFIAPFAIAVDTGGNAYVTGDCGAGLPIVGGFQTGPAGNDDACVVKMNATGSALVYSSYLGGTSFDQGNAIAVDPSGNAYISGQTISVDFPLVAQQQGPLGGGVSKSLDGGSTWAISNSGLGSQRITSLVADPKNSGVLYAASPQSNPAGTLGGVYKSTNGGATWTRMVTGLTFKSVQILAIDPVTTTTLYAGTNGGGVFKSTDGAATWNVINSGLGIFNITALAVDPKFPITIYAGGSFTPNPVYKSTNGGAGWTLSSTGLGFSTVNALVIDPVNSGTIYDASSNGVAKSTDGGATWNLPANTLRGQSVQNLVINISNPTVLYASLANSNGADIYKSNTGGLTWVPIGVDLVGVDGAALAIDSSSGTLYVSGQRVVGGFYKSADGGVTFQDVSIGLNNRAVESILVDPFAPLTVYVGSRLRSGFLAKINPSGSALTYSTYVGGGGFTQALGVAADGGGNSYVVGLTSSRDFQTTSGSLQTTYPGGAYHSFASKYSSSGAISYSTFLDGNTANTAVVAVSIYSSSTCTGICDGTPYSGLVGTFTSNNVLFGASQGSFNWHPFGLGSFSALFAGTLNVAGSGSYQFSLSSDDGSSLYIDGVLVLNNGGIHGPNAVTSSPVALGAGSHTFQVNFLETSFGSSGVDLTLPAGVTYGSPATEENRGPSFGFASSVAVDSSANAYIAGGSNALDFPLVNHLQSVPNTAYVAELNPTGSSILFSTFFGSSAGGSNPNLALDGSNNILVTDTISFYSLNNYPTQNAVQSSPGGGNSDAVVFKISPAASTTTNPVPVASAFSFGNGNGNGNDDDGFLTVLGSNFVINSVVLFNGAVVPTFYVNPGLLQASPPIKTPSGSFTIAVSNPAPGGGVSNVLKVNFGAYNLKALGFAAHEAGSPALSLALKGTDFAPGMVALWNGQPRVTTFVSSTELSAAIPASDLAIPGTALVSLTDPASGLRSKPLSFAVTDFTISASPGDMIVSSGAAATEKLSFTPQFGDFNRAVMLTCSGLPQFSSCAFSPNPLTPGAAGASATLTISTSAQTIGMNAAPGPLDAARGHLPGSLALFSLMLPGLAWMGAACGGRRSGKKNRRRARLKTWLVFLALGISLIQTGCGGGGSNFMAPAKSGTSSTLPGIYEITISATSGSIVHTTTVRLTVQ